MGVPKTHVTSTVTGILFGLLTITAWAQHKVNVQLSGVTRDAVTGKILYCTIELFDRNGQLQAVTQTNNDGRYALLVPPRKQFELRISEDGYSSRSWPIAAIDPGVKLEEFDLYMEP